MLNLSEIEKSIKELESGPTTFSNCQKLAILYTCKDHIINSNQSDTETDKNVIKEYSDILPEYSEYCNIKRKYKLNEITAAAVIKEIKDVCKEITEFINTLYSSTDMPEERERILQMIADLQTIGK